MPTWVATSELGGRHAHTRTAKPPVAAFNASSSGHILVDRHLEKNGGTAFRDVLKEAQLNGLCMYWGFQLRSVIWSQVLDRLPSLDTPPICRMARSMTSGKMLQSISGFFRRRIRRIRWIAG